MIPATLAPEADRLSRLRARTDRQILDFIQTKLDAALRLAGRAGADSADGAPLAAQQSLTIGTQFRALDAPLQEAPARRLAGGVVVAGRFVPLRYPLRDGWVALGPAFLPSTGHFMKRLLAWALEEGFGDAAAIDEDWSRFIPRLMSRETTIEVFAPVRSI